MTCTGTCPALTARDAEIETLRAEVSRLRRALAAAKALAYLDTLDAPAPATTDSQ